MSIDQFVDNRVADAKQVLRTFDPDFVYRIENAVRLEDIGLITPQELIGQSWQPTDPPKKRLSTEWHRLLEECHELTVQTRHYQTAALNMTAEVYTGMNDIDAGRQFNYNLYTFVVYQAALIDHVKMITSLIVKVYTPIDRSPNQLKKRYHDRANQWSKEITGGRNNIVHGGGFASQGITEGQLWEGNVAAGVTPQRFLDEIHYLDARRRVKSGQYDFVKDGTDAIIDEISAMLHDLENDIHL